MAITTANVGLAASTITYTSTNDTAVTFMSLCNYSAGPVICDIHLIAGGGGVYDNTNILIQGLSINNGDTYILYQGNEKIFLSDTDEIVVVPAVSGTDVITTITSYMEV